MRYHKSNGVGKNNTGRINAYEIHKTVTLKNGKTCLLRNATLNDAESVLANFDIVREETDYLLSYLDEKGFSIDDEKVFLENKENSPDEVQICAVIDNRLVGMAGLSKIGVQEKLRHRVEFGISIEKRYWGLGVGRALTLSCIDCAKKASYKQIELEVVAENQNAVNLYESIGFIEYGRNPRGFISRYTGYQELILMRLELV
nr:GNAT family N-acetyltransferase [Treponema phagedenis]